MLPNSACIARFVRRFLTKHGEGADRNVDARITDKDRPSAAGALDREMQRAGSGLHTASVSPPTMAAKRSLQPSASTKRCVSADGLLVHSASAIPRAASASNAASTPG